MMSWQWTGDGFVSGAVVPVSDRGFRYGMSVFETVRISGGQAEFLEEHLHRLQNACEDRRFRPDTRALAAVGALLDGSGLEGVARIYVTAGEGGVEADAGENRIFLLAEARGRPGATAYHVNIADTSIEPLFGGLKTGNYWANLAAVESARRLGFDETLIFNGRAELVSAGLANVFIVQGNRVRTPARECGARDGVIRQWVMRHVVADECSLFMDDVVSAEEMFLTNSWIGVISVASCDRRELSSQRVAAGLQHLLRGSAA